jgi:hypothetical protein
VIQQDESTRARLARCEAVDMVRTSLARLERGELKVLDGLAQAFVTLGADRDLAVAFAHATRAAEEARREVIKSLPDAELRARWDTAQRIVPGDVKTIDTLRKLIRQIPHEDHGWIGRCAEEYGVLDLIRPLIDPNFVSKFEAGERPGNRSFPDSNLTAVEGAIAALAERAFRGEL